MCAAIYVPVSAEYSFNLAFIHFYEHYSIVLSFLNYFPDRAKFNATPFFLLIFFAQKNHYQP